MCHSDTGQFRSDRRRFGYPIAPRMVSHRGDADSKGHQLVQPVPAKGDRIGLLGFLYEHSGEGLCRVGYSFVYNWTIEITVNANCILFRGFGLHAGVDNLLGSITVKDKACFNRLVYQIERKSTSEKMDVYQCRKCIFQSCWLGTRILPNQRTYLTNLRSF